MGWDLTAGEALVDTVETLLITKLVLNDLEDVLGPQAVIHYDKLNVGGAVLVSEVAAIADRVAFLALVDATDALAPRASLIAHVYAQMVIDGTISAGAVV